MDTDLYVKSAQSSLQVTADYYFPPEAAWIAVLRDEKLVGSQCVIVGSEVAIHPPGGPTAHLIMLADGRLFVVSPEQLGQTVELLEG